MKKGKIFTNCFLVISAILTTASFFGCSTDEEFKYIIDEKVPLEMEIPLGSVHPNDTVTLFISAQKNDIADTIQ